MFEPPFSLLLLWDGTIFESLKLAAWRLVLQTYHEEDEVGQPTEDEGSNNNSKLSRELTNQKRVFNYVNQSEASIILCQPIIRCTNHLSGSFLLLG